MGQTFSCETCPTAITHSVITFSEPLVMKLTEDIEPEPLTAEELRKREIGDDEWFEQIRCIDEKHSLAYGLTNYQFDMLMDRIEKRLKECGLKQNPCSANMILECYKRQASKGCVLNCAKCVKAYTSCIDGKTMKLFHQYYKEHEALRRTERETANKIKNKNTKTAKAVV